MNGLASSFLYGSLLQCLHTIFKFSTNIVDLFASERISTIHIANCYSGNTKNNSRSNTVINHLTVCVYGEYNFYSTVLLGNQYCTNMTKDKV